MPIYEYRCQACDEVFEVFQKMTDPPPKAHSCGGTQVTRLLSNTTFRLVGTGWYATDYAAKKAPDAEASRRDGGSEKRAEGKKGDAPDKAAAKDSKSASDKASGAPTKPKASSP